MSKEALDWVENIFEEHHVQLPDIELTLIRQALTELEELKRYPTADEVCEALNTDVQLYPKIFYYDEISKTFKEIHISRNEEIVSYYTNGTITINPNYGIPPHLITLIGRFYEGLEKAGKNDGK